MLKIIRSAVLKYRITLILTHKQNIRMNYNKERKEINTHTDFEYWKKKIIEETIDFCDCKAPGFFERRPNLVCKKEYCKNGVLNDVKW